MKQVFDEMLLYMHEIIQPIIDNKYVLLCELSSRSLIQLTKHSLKYS